MLNAFLAHPYSYGVIVFFASVVGITILAKNLKTIYYPIASIIKVATIISFAALIGARSLYIAVFPSQFANVFEVLAIHQGGFVFYGGLLLAIFALFTFAKINDLSVSALFDACAPALAFAHAIGRLGCLSNHCCYGIKTSINTYYRLPGESKNIFRHPTQLYEACFLLALGAILQFFYLSENKKHLSGFVAFFYLCAYTLFRFLIEFIRGDNRGPKFTSLNLSVSQLIGLVMLAAAAITYQYRTNFR
jgi:phosphatidylglycerol:prolipoprotein diacylglycerol transferase